MILTDAVRSIANFASSSTLADVSTEVVDRGRLLLLDTVGALLGGLRYPAVQSLAQAIDGTEPASVTDAPFLRLATLGTAATWLDADSGGSFHPQGHRLPPVPTAHPAPHSLPVLLHAAAAGDIEDRRLLEVFLIANEIGMRAGVASSLRPGMHPHGVHGPAASAIAATLLREGSRSELERAFLLASSLPMAATLAVPMHGGTVRNIWTGLGAYYGACASQWAASGGMPNIEVFSALFDSAVCTDLSPDQLAGDLGTRWQISHSYIKPYACARWIHPTLDATLAAITASEVGPDDVESIDVQTFAFAASLNSIDIRSDLHARFSLPYCVATLLFDKGLYADSFLPDRLSRPEVLALATRVSVTEKPAYSAALPHERPSTVTIHKRTGEPLTASARSARGNPSSALPHAEVELKFRRNAGGLVGSEYLDAVVDGLLKEDHAHPTSLGRLSRKLLADFRL